jgi:hypothetical protein
LFSFEVYSTPDFLFRIASFREFSWEYEKGIDGMSDNKPNYPFKNQPQILDESEYKALLKKISAKVHEQANEDLNKNSMIEINEKSRTSTAVKYLG